jgi:hypothetical protein
MEYHKVTYGKPLVGHRVEIEFDDGTRKVIDVSPLIVPDTVFWKLSDPEFFFNEFGLHHNTVAWGAKTDPTSAIDISPEWLYGS